MATDDQGEFGTAWTSAMLAGDDEKAWTISDQVLRRRDPVTRDDPRLPYHRRWVWDGRAFQGEHVLVRCYHGLGDTLQFARFLPLLAAEAASLTVEVQPALRPLLVGVVPQARLIDFREDAPTAPMPCMIEIMELQHALRLRPSAAPAPPYLNVRPSRRTCSGIGVCWQAGGWDPDRSVPLARLADALQGRGLWCLQPSPPPPGPDWRNPHGCPRNLADTASLVAGLDLVITVDTMMAHLAGALGRPTWLLLKHDADWRWMRHRRDTPWYPSMRLFRQTAAGNWDDVLQAVGEAAGS